VDGFEVAAADLPALDVTDPGSVERLVSSVLERHGRLDALVNAAGIAGPSAPVADYPYDAWRRVLDVNLTGAFLCMRQCLPPMLERGYGRIVNIASIAGSEGNPEMPAYSASKAGVIALTRSAGKELARSGVLVNCVVAAVFDAGLTHRATEAERETFVSRVPMGRMGRPEELAELVAWLASERCSFSTGAAFDATGGRG
jgi:3-oxoacyl-[acyl-carrier protein] reductase